MSIVVVIVVLENICVIGLLTKASLSRTVPKISIRGGCRGLAAAKAGSRILIGAQLKQSLSRLLGNSNYDKDQSFTD